MKNNNRFKKRAFLTICMLLGMVSIAGSNHTYVNKLPTIYRTDVEQSLDSLSKILDYVTTTTKEQETITSESLSIN